MTNGRATILIASIHFLIEIALLAIAAASDTR
jgi:hypothetical protein